MFSIRTVAKLPVASEHGSRIRSMSNQDLPAVADYDRAAFGAERAYLLEDLQRRLPDGAHVAGRAWRVVGFIPGRNGRACTQLGPLVADDLGTALGLLQHALAAVARPICLDIADHYSGLRYWLDAQGSVAVVPFTRMVRGRDEPFDDPQRIFAIAGPEIG